ncbi:hypothetical protein [Saccharopolyspora shandongensis]|uniref:hypothetical protein n=1 Tax=Saccharopolyspora shandongensis TaxID=418495 RepID=UPI0033E936D7
METIAESPAIVARPIDPEPIQQITPIASEEEVAILARADELNTRIARILEEFGG